MGQALLGIRVEGVSFEVAVHLATLVSVLLVFRKRVTALIAGAFRLDRKSLEYLGLLLLATVPAAVVGLGARDFLSGLFEAPFVAGLALLVTGSFLWTAKGALARDPGKAPGPREAIVMGLAQAFAIIPGISRSGATVVVGLWLGVEAEEAAAFSFLMAVPAILGAAILELPGLFQGGAAPATGGLGPEAASMATSSLLVGSLVAAVAGVLAIRTFVAMLKRKSFHRFGPYCWGAGALFLLYLFLQSQG